MLFFLLFHWETFANKDGHCLNGGFLPVMNLFRPGSESSGCLQKHKGRGRANTRQPSSFSTLLLKVSEMAFGVIPHL